MCDSDLLLLSIRIKLICQNTVSRINFIVISVVQLDKDISLISCLIHHEKGHKSKNFERRKKKQTAIRALLV